MEDLFVETLENLKLPVIKQGTLAEEDQYPDTFITFWNNSSDGESFYDNDEHSCLWDFDVNVYSVDPEEVNSVLIKIKKILRENKFIANGKGYDVASDEPTHTGRGINVQMIEGGI